ncbi:hypothetical protein Glove_100g30 [Diversispora epigaea]|uniref:Protein arginine N-methyltransferase n=1 Tax=Diversispora epigaea TaxID=1348612 RepID=A0A397JAL4_9GLOM|nr:hypothetical protein Glove_100g30 [Diversispora epigaea]
MTDNNTSKNQPPRISVGLYRSQEDPDTVSSSDDARQFGHDFIILPIVSSSYKRFISGQNEQLDNTKNSKVIEEWRKNHVFFRDDLVIKNTDLVDYVVGQVSDWLDFDSPDHNVQINSEIALRQQISWACHLGISAVLISFPSTNSIMNYARSLNSILGSLTYTHVWCKIPLVLETEIMTDESRESSVTWERWNKFRVLCEHNSKLSIALEISAQLPDDKDLERWFAEPIKAIILPTSIFLTNAKGYPVLSKKHQTFVRKMIKYKPNFVISCNADSDLHENNGLAAYQEYIRYLNRTIPELTQIEQFANGYQDFLQSPLQPLMDNLESSTYEIFERDNTKYIYYEKAIYHALLDRVPPESDETTVIMVVGAGRGPLVTRSLSAAEKANRRVRIYALEKNPNAFVSLQNMKTEVWGDAVTLAFSDMRLWKPPEKADLLISELLGSFGDNELSPECLDGAQKFLKPDGVSIPASYSTFISPISSTKLYNEVAAHKDFVHFETPYVVMFQSASELTESQEIWRFEHPNKSFEVDDNEMPINNYHNTRYSKVTFDIKQSGMLHGIAGYFESILYKDISISIRPTSHTKDMFSWFPIFFPIKTPIYLPSKTKLEIHFWRLSASQKVWYEWCVETSYSSGVDTISLGSPSIHNVSGRSSWIGLLS